MWLVHPLYLGFCIPSGLILVIPQPEGCPVKDPPEECLKDFHCPLASGRVGPMGGTHESSKRGWCVQSLAGSWIRSNATEPTTVTQTQCDTWRWDVGVPVRGFAVCPLLEFSWFLH